MQRNTSVVVDSIHKYGMTVGYQGCQCEYLLGEIG